MVPPLALDIDGTLTTPSGAIDPRVFEALPEWEAPVVLATGKAFPYPVALCHFLGLPETVIAENGGVTLVDGEVRTVGTPDDVAAAAAAFEARGGQRRWSDDGTVNRWRETEIAFSRAVDADLLRAVAEEFELSVVDTGYAYHLKDPAVEKGAGLELVADALGYDPAAFVAVGDSENDVSTFGVAGASYAVSNADDRAREAADEVLDASHFDGTRAALDAVRDRVR